MSMILSPRWCSILLASALVVGCDSAPQSSAPAPASATAQSGGIELVEVRELVELAEDAARRNDLPAAFAFLAEDVMIVSTEPGPDGKVSTTMRDKAEFMKAQTEAAAQYPDSRYTSEITEVAPAPDGAGAIAKVKAEQTLSDQGRVAHASFEQVLTIQPRNGALKIVVLKTTITGLTIDGSKVF